jgi:PLD-like domain
MLLQKDNLAARLDVLLASATAVDIAVAWITSEHLTDQLLKFAARPGCRLRVITGVYDYLTSASAIRRLHALGVVRIAVPTDNYKFHPKLYLFTIGNTRTCWIGSANLTQAAFGGNVELVYECGDTGAAATWFESEWTQWPSPNDDWLDVYEDCAAQRQAARPAASLIPAPALPLAPAPPQIVSAGLGSPLDNWPAYVHALKQADAEWMAKTKGKSGIYSGQGSWVATIRAAMPLFSKDWSTLSRAEARILLGKADEGNTFWGQLGCMKGAGIANNVFLEPTAKNIKTRRTIQDAIDELCHVPLGNALPLMARKAHEVIGNLNGFSGGVATRLLALARPEVLVSVNSESVDRLAGWSSMPKAAIGTSKGYESFIRWVMQGKWWRGPEPSDPLDRELWLYRAALIDGLAYNGEQLEEYA